jgi:Na+/phosphate symporter
MSLGTQKPYTASNKEPKISKSTKTKKQKLAKKENVFDVYKECINKYFKEVQRGTAEYLQSLTNLQQEIIQVRKNTADSVIEFQQKFAHGLKLNAKSPEPASNLFVNIGEQCRKAQDLQNQVLLTTVEVLRKNIKAFNDNSSSFENLNKKVLQTCNVPTLDQKQSNNV